MHERLDLFFFLHEILNVCAVCAVRLLFDFVRERLNISAQEKLKPFLFKGAGIFVHERSTLFFVREK